MEDETNSHTAEKKLTYFLLFISTEINIVYIYR